MMNKAPRPGASNEVHRAGIEGFGEAFNSPDSKMSGPHQGARVRGIGFPPRPPGMDGLGASVAATLQFKDKFGYWPYELDDPGERVARHLHRSRQADRPPDDRANARGLIGDAR
jgi:hypothetical protein